MDTAGATCRCMFTGGMRQYVCGAGGGGGAGGAG
jgi:hypothetical protein